MLLHLFYVIKVFLKKMYTVRLFNLKVKLFGINTRITSIFEYPLYIIIIAFLVVLLF